MTLREKLFEPDESDRAVSPVIGVILMVAITVILAAVIGTFVLQIGQQTGDQAPSVSASISDSDNNYEASETDQNAFRIQVQSTDRRIDMSNIRIVVRDPDTGEVETQLDQDSSYKDGDGNVAGSDTTNLLLSQNDGTSNLAENQFQSGDIFVISDEGSQLSDNTEYEIVISYLGGDQPEQIVSSTVELR